jgi:hypothetical protein
MALVEMFHVVAAERPVASGQTIKEGQMVALNSSGEVILYAGSNAAVYGVAADTKHTSQSYMPGVGSSVTGAYDGIGALGTADTVNFQNRASDYFDETKASGKMTVYHSGGEFATDQFATNVASAAPGTYLYANANGVLDTYDAAGLQWKGVTGSTGVVPPCGIVLKADGSYPSGVPGIDINGDQALSGENSNTYIEYKLLV